MILNWLEFLLESKLNKKELSKKLKGRSRFDILLDKLKSGDPILINGVKKWVTEILDKDGNFRPISDIDFNTIDIDHFLKGRNYREVLKTADGELLKLNMIDKTRDFGSSGPGRRTKEMEILQSIFLDIYQLYKDEIIWDIEDIDVELINDIFQDWKLNDQKGVFVSNIPERMENIDDYWLKTLIIPTKEIYKIIGIEKEWSVYHTSYKGVESPYRMFFDKWKKTKNIKSVTNFNKWCPADVWIIEKGKESELKSELDKIKLIDENIFIEELRAVLNRFFLSGTLYPISMKKILSTGFDIIINNELGKELPSFELESLIIGDVSSGLRGIGSRLKVKSKWNGQIKSRIVTIDSSNTNLLINVDAEVEGKSSRHGKVSYNIIKRIVSNIDLKLVDILKDWSFYKEWDIEKLKECILETTNNIENSNLNIIKVNTGYEIENSKNKMVSRLQSLLVLEVLSKMNQEQLDIFINNLMLWALSIKTDVFTTPMYIRII